VKPNSQKKNRTITEHSLLCVRARTETQGSAQISTKPPPMFGLHGEVA
ncbi:uncharacterized protein METZ01_LOCUS318269, partial [marine metagenome]